MPREFAKDVSGRPYAGNLEQRCEQAMEIVCEVAAEQRTFLKSIPGGSGLHSKPCMDEDIFLLDILQDMWSEISAMRVYKDSSTHELISKNALALLRDTCAKLAKFKEWVHNFLDKEGVPADPYPELNAQHGCRISCRLKWWKQKVYNDGQYDADKPHGELS